MGSRKKPNVMCGILVSLSLLPCGGNCNLICEVPARYRSSTSYAYTILHGVRLGLVNVFKQPFWSN